MSIKFLKDILAGAAAPLAGQTSEQAGAVLICVFVFYSKLQITVTAGCDTNFSHTANLATFVLRPGSHMETPDTLHPYPEGSNIASQAALNDIDSFLPPTCKKSGDVRAGFW